MINDGDLPSLRGVGSVGIQWPPTTAAARGTTMTTVATKLVGRSGASHALREDLQVREEPYPGLRLTSLRRSEEGDTRMC